MSSIEFIAWLQNELQCRGWGQAELARRSRIPAAQISRIMTGETQAPRPEACVKIARALQLPPEEVFRRAGLLPRRATPDDAEEALFYYSHLDAHDRGSALAMLRALYERYGRKDEQRE